MSFLYYRDKNPHFKENSCPMHLTQADKADNFGLNCHCYLFYHFKVIRTALWYRYHHLYDLKKGVVTSQTSIGKLL